MGATRLENSQSLPALLDSELERFTEMRSLVFWLTAPLLVMGVMCLVTPACAFEIPFLGIKIFEPPADPIINETATVTGEPSLVITKEYFYLDKSIIDAVTRIIGIGDKGQANVTILHNGKTLAIIPEGSRFENIRVHEACLEKYQYGTEDWYACEVSR